MALLFFAIVIFAMRFATLWEPLDRDLATYVVLGRELLGGRELYTDLWDNKPPGLFIAFAGWEAAVGLSEWGVLALNVLLSILTLLGVYRLARSVTVRPLTPLFAAGIYALISGAPSLQANQPNAELFINAFQVWGLCFCVALFQTPAKAASVRALFLSGLCFGLASLFKHVAVVIGVLLVGYACLQRIRRPSSFLKFGAAFALGLLLPWVATLAHFALSGRNGILMDSIFGFSRSYAGNLPLNLLRTFGELRFILPEFMRGLCFLVLLALAVAFSDRKRNPSLFAFWMLWFGGLVCQIGLTGRFYPHYWQYWLPFIPLLIARGYDGFDAYRVTWRRALRLGFLAALLIFAFKELRPLFRGVDALSIEKYGDIFVQSRELGRQIRARHPEEKWLYAWSIDPSLYYYSGMRPVAGALWCMHLSQRSVVQKHLDESSYARLAERKPKFVIVDNRSPECPWDPSSLKTLRYIQENYIAGETLAPGVIEYVAK